MMGHSAGAHLCVLSVLELTLKKLLHNPEAVLQSHPGPPIISVSQYSENISFEDKHFNGNNASSTSVGNDDMELSQAGASTTGSFYVVDEKENEKSFVLLSENSLADRKAKLSRAI